VKAANWPDGAVQKSQLLSIKTGGCPEDCGYCPQSAHYETGVAASKMMTAEDVREAVLGAKAAGASRFCMGAAWRAPNDRDLEKVEELVRVVKDEGLEACCTLGMLTEQQAQRLLFRGAFSVGNPSGGLPFISYNPFDLSVKGIANTGVVHWGGKLLALFEVGAWASRRLRTTLHRSLPLHAWSALRISTPLTN
jgi:hypothetical protein